MQEYKYARKEPKQGAKLTTILNTGKAENNIKNLLKKSEFLSYDISKILHQNLKC